MPRLEERCNQKSRDKVFALTISFFLKRNSLFEFRLHFTGKLNKASIKTFICFFKSNSQVSFVTKDYS